MFSDIESFTTYSYAPFDYLSTGSDPLTFYQYPIFIADTLDFVNWQAVVSRARKVITIECGASHIAELYNKETIVVYHTDNCPELISAEYYPWTDYFTPIICPRLEINDRVMQELKKTVALN